MRKIFSPCLGNAVKLLALLFLSVFIFACQSNSTGPSGVPGGSPLPPMPSSGGTSGTPSSEPSTQLPSDPSDSQDQNSDSSANLPENGESSDSPSSTETSPDWEEEIESDGSSGQDSEVTFEEPDESLYEEPDFEETGAMTEQELEELERELNESLGDFDEEIQREKTFAEERANDNVDDGPLGGIGVFESYEDDSDNDDIKTVGSSAERSEEATNSSDSGDAATNAGEGTGEQKSQSEGIGSEEEERETVSVDIPDQSIDDDIVARQIREAAENETDPELKEKLWAEYRKYKSQ